ncbi:hypothetical protein [Actinoplanes subtropicus]|uniref:hypothetical protein n=1 Tax=Actinoplanes subtropicus TaxID=543632 RepID=UPI0004C325F6|nr:hypothetical protein [Actinoplanes subtropicus]
MTAEDHDRPLSTFRGFCIRLPRPAEPPTMAPEPAATPEERRKDAVAAAREWRDEERDAVDRRVGLRLLLETERNVNCHPYQPLNGWQVCQATAGERDFAERGKVPAWHFWAAFWDLSSPVVVAETLPELEAGVWARQEQMYARLPVPFRNRRILAERQDWPEGVLEECEALEQRRPAWSVTWRLGTGYVGRLDVAMHRCELTAEDPYELDAAMDQVPEHDWSTRGCAWCLARLEQRR